MAVFSALERLRQKQRKFRGVLGYTAKLGFKISKRKKRKGKIAVIKRV